MIALFRTQDDARIEIVPDRFPRGFILGDGDSMRTRGRGQLKLRAKAAIEPIGKDKTALSSMKSLPGQQTRLIEQAAG
jgi:hypothetical protein